MMNLFAVWRTMAKLEYAAVRLPFTLLDGCVVAATGRIRGSSVLASSVSLVRSMSSLDGSCR